MREEPVRVTVQPRLQRSDMEMSERSRVVSGKMWVGMVTVVVGPEDIDDDVGVMVSVPEATDVIWEPFGSPTVSPPLPKGIVPFDATSDARSNVSVAPESAIAVVVREEMTVDLGVRLVGLGVGEVAEETA